MTFDAVKEKIRLELQRNMDILNNHTSYGWAERTIANLNILDMMGIDTSGWADRKRAEREIANG